MRDLHYALRFLWTHKSFAADGRPDAGHRPRREHGVVRPAQRGAAAAPPAASRADRRDRRGGQRRRHRRISVLVLDGGDEGLPGTGRVVQRGGGHDAAHRRTVGRRPRVAVLVRRGQRQLLHGPRRHPRAGNALHRPFRIAGSRRPRSHVLDEDVRRRPERHRQADPDRRRTRRHHRRRRRVVSRHADGRRARRLRDARRLRRARPRRAALAVPQPEGAAAPAVRAAQTGCEPERSAGRDGRPDENARDRVSRDRQRHRRAGDS